MTVAPKTDLQKAVYEGDIVEFVKRCRDYTETNEEQQTFLHFAAAGTAVKNVRYSLDSWIEIGKILPQEESFINAKDKNGNTAFHYAVGGCDPAFIYWLISVGALITENNNNDTPITLADGSIHKTRFKEAKKQLKRADGSLYLAGHDGLLNIEAPKKFHCPNRFSLRTAKMLAMLAKVIYKGEGNDIGETVSIGNNMVRAFVKRWGFSSVKIVEKNDARAMVLQRDATDHEPKIYCIAFRGTKTMKDVLTDITAIKASGGQHSGFGIHLKKISEVIVSELNKHDDAPIYVTGHSLGGAMATLMMAKLAKLGFSASQLHMYTFGQPRAGTKEFQSIFDDDFENAYIVQRYLDPVPLVPTFSGHVVGGYTHSGSLRFLDSFGQLYNDVHYQYEDINRGVMAKTKNQKTSLQDLRHFWTEGFQQLAQVAVNEEKTTMADLGIDEFDNNRDTVDATLESVPCKSSLQKDTNVIFNMIKGGKDALAAHGMLNYLKDIAMLESRVNSPFSWDDPELAITSQLTTVTLPLDVYDEIIKGKRYKREQEAAYQHWVKYYTKLPGNSYSLDSSISCGNIVPWIRQDSVVLQQLSDIEQAIVTQHPELVKSSQLPKRLHRREISPLVEVGMYSIIDLLTQLAKTDEPLAISYYRWLYWALPDSGYKLKQRSILASSPSFLLEHESLSPYRRGLRNSLIHLSRFDSSSQKSLEDMAKDLPDIAEADNGLRIAKLTSTIHRMQKQWLKSRHEAKVELSNLEFAIIGEMIRKFKKVSLQAGVVCAAGATAGVVTGTVSGVTTGLTIATLSGGVATPTAIMAGVGVGTAVGVGTTGAVIGVVALKKLPKFFSSLKQTLTKFETHLIGLIDPETKSQHEIALSKVARSKPTRTRVVLLLLNGLYVTLALVKLNRPPINPHKRYRNSLKIDNNPFKKRQLETFFLKVLSLVNQYIAVINLGEDGITSHLKTLETLMGLLELHPDVYQDIFTKLGEIVGMPNPDVGVEVFRSQYKLNESMQHLNGLLAKQLKPEGVEMRISSKGKKPPPDFPEDLNFSPCVPSFRRTRGLAKKSAEARVAWQKAVHYFSSSDDAKRLEQKLAEQPTTTDQSLVATDE